MNTSTDLRQYLKSRYLPMAMNGKTKSAKYKYMSSVNRLSVMLGRAATLEDLTAHTVSIFEDWYEEGHTWQTRVQKAYHFRLIAEFAIKHGDLPKSFPLPPPKVQPAWENKVDRHIPGEPPAVITQDTLLQHFVSRYTVDRNEVRPIGRELKGRSIEAMGDTVAVLSHWLGRQTTVADLNAKSINDFLAGLVRKRASPYSAKAHRTRLMILWRHANRIGVLPTPPNAIRMIHIPGRQLDGYDVNDMCYLLQYAECMSGVMRGTGIPKNLYWPSLIRVKWELGLRAGDMMAMRLRDFQDGLLWVYENKTWKEGWKKVRPDTREAIEKCIAFNPRRDLIWDGLVARSFYRAFVSLARAAGLKGSSKWIRRGAASEVERGNIGMGWRFLNHSTQDLFEKHYRVGRIATPLQLMPPEIKPQESKGGAA